MPTPITPTTPGLYPRRGPKASFSDANSVQPGELVLSTDTDEIGTEHGWQGGKNAGGKLLSAYFLETPAQRQTIESSTPVSVIGLSITVTPEYEDSMFIIQANVLSTFRHVASMFIYINGEKQMTHANSNEDGANNTIYYGSNSNSYLYPVVIQGRHFATSKDPVTIEIRMLSAWANTVYPLYVNDRSENDMRGVSTMIVQEIKPTL